MTKRIIDVLESINVNEQHRRMTLVLFGKFQRCIHMGQHETPIRQPSERISLSGMNERSLRGCVGTNSMNNSGSNCY